MKSMRHIESFSEALMAASSRSDEARIVAQYVWSKSTPGRCELPMTHRRAFLVPSLFILYTHIILMSRLPIGMSFVEITGHDLFLSWFFISLSSDASHPSRLCLVLTQTCDLSGCLCLVGR